MTSAFLQPAAIRRLLSPRSVAIVGASETPGSLGAAVLANLDRMGYRGDVHLINPNRDRIGGRPCLKSADLLPPGIDAAVLAIPRPAVLDAVGALARRQVGAAIVFSSGFAEGGADGAREQQELARVAADSGMVVEADYRGTSRQRSYGNTILIDHGGGRMTTLYGHLRGFTVKVGQFVEKGEIIGYVGSSGRSTGPHLHFEVRVNGSPTNPLGYYH